jgi:AraC-like DNA-binding protein
MRIGSIFGTRRRPALSLGYGLDVYVGYETQTQKSGYCWNGLKRGADPTRPLAIIQYTLAGEGAFRAGTQSIAQRPGGLFAAIAPSDHEYYLPNHSSQWTFVWVIVHHPYMVSRLQSLNPPAGPALQSADDSELVANLLDLIDAHRRRADDRFTREQRLFNLMLAIERLSFASAHKQDRREQLLQRVRDVLEEDPAHAPGVKAVAEAFGMSRSNFSHHFRLVTGLSPAVFMRDLRLQRAREMLLSGALPMKAIARQTGFADTNHLCKAFRRRFGFTPGSFRQQVSAKSTARMSVRPSADD